MSKTVPQPALPPRVRLRLTRAVGQFVNELGPRANHGRSYQHFGRGGLLGFRGKKAIVQVFQQRGTELFDPRHVKGWCPKKAA